jgi:hypothetical protein
MVAQKKMKSPVQENSPVVETPVVETVAQKGGAKKPAAPKKAQAKQSEIKEKEPEIKEPIVVKKTKGVTKKAAAPKVENKVENKEEKTEQVEDADADDGKTRSFKVKLPGSADEEFSGRFTGLTPYQAANKALSKFFRNNENNNISTEPIVFSIKESTRGSKRHTYTYKGLRVKLDQAITYTIKSASGEERVITKQYKNQLIKVKKGVAPVVQQPVASA